jgi:CO dehydrogenase nickel-insertion accessory protein CooC1
MKIAISGKMGSGKDYVANIILRTNKKYKRVAFADDLKSMVFDNFEITKDWIVD